jgi:hypothetical protein
MEDEDYIKSEDFGIKPGTIGYNGIFNPNQQIPLIDYALKTQGPFFEDSEYLEEINPDELLRDLGFYDSTDARSCINRKKR